MSKYFLTESIDGFEPGEIAYARGSLHECFNELLEDKGYTLHPTEKQPIHYEHTGRYCIVLRRLGSDRYLICYLTTYGGSKSYSEVKNPVGRFFGLPIGEGYRWPGIPSLKTRPMWVTRAYVLGIPVVREGLQRANLSRKFRLYPSELQRAKILIRERLKVSDGDLLNTSII